AKNAIRLDVDVDLEKRAIVGHTFHLLGEPFSADALPSDRVQSAVTDVMQRYAPSARAEVVRAKDVMSPNRAAALAAKAAIEVLSADAAVADADTVSTPLNFGPLSLEDFLESF